MVHKDVARLEETASTTLSYQANKRLTELLVISRI
jgi:hypothetical protein